MKRVLFLDGLGCNPESFKVRFIRSLGYEVTAPQLPDLDFDAALAVAEKAVAESTPDVIVGYSRGGGIAMMLTDQITPRMLIAPSLKYVRDGASFPGRLVILHSATDDGLPLDVVQSHLVRCRLQTAQLQIVGEDHTMIDPPVLLAITEALKDLSSDAAQS